LFPFTTFCSGAEWLSWHAPELQVVPVEELDIALIEVVVEVVAEP
jgi:hypothetical protein